MLRRVLILFLIPLMFDLASCWGDCSEIEIIYTNTGFALFNIDNSGSGPVASLNDTVPKNAYGLKVIFQREAISQVRETVPCSFFIQRAYAMTKCKDYVAIPTDTLVSFHIYTVNDFDDTHPAGSDITSYFYNFDGEDYVPAANAFYMMKYQGGRQATTDVDLTLLLMTAPALNTSHQFRVELEITGKGVITQTTSIELI